MLNQEAISNLAKLSRLSFEPSELAKLEADLNNILNYVSQLNEAKVDLIDNSQISPPDYLAQNVFRADGPAHAPGEFSAELIEAFPQKSGDYLQVKKVL